MPKYVVTIEGRLVTDVAAKVKVEAANAKEAKAKANVLLMNDKIPTTDFVDQDQPMLTSTKAKVNEIVYWSKPVNWKNQTLTPNPDSIYLMSFWNVKVTPAPGVPS